MKRLNKKTYKAIKQAKAVITITQHGDVVKLNVDFLPPAKNKSPKLFQYLAIKMCNHAMEILGGKKNDKEPELFSDGCSHRHKKIVGAYNSAGVRFTDLDDVNSGRYPRELRYGNPRAINAGRAIYPVR